METSETEILELYTRQPSGDQRGTDSVILVISRFVVFIITASRINMIYLLMLYIFVTYLIAFLFFILFLFMYLVLFIYLFIY